MDRRVDHFILVPIDDGLRSVLPTEIPQYVSKGLHDAISREPPAADRSDRPLCECELPGPFCSGVPGILAAVIDSHALPDAKIERCDACQKYPSDVAAREKLQELGLLPDTIGAQSNYRVHCYMLVRVSLPPRPAANAQDAARSVQEQFDWNAVDPARVEFVEPVEFLVDVEGDEEHLHTKRFAANLAELPR